MSVPWGTLINTALDQGLGSEDALLAVLDVASLVQSGDVRLIDSPGLTPAEARALATFFAADGDVDACAATLGVTVGTFRQQTKAARRKLGVKKTWTAVFEAGRRGLLPEEVAE